MRLVWLGGLMIAVAGLGGCHSAYVEATVVNRSGKAISPVEVDYPSASFGTQTLAEGESYHYRFKVLGSGGLKLIYTDAAHQDHGASGPELGEGDEGSLLITIEPGGGAGWDTKLTNRKGK